MSSEIKGTCQVEILSILTTKLVSYSQNFSPLKFHFWCRASVFLLATLLVSHLITLHRAKINTRYLPNESVSVYES